MKKPYLHAHWQPFLPTQWQTFSILSPKASTKSLPERHYWQFEKNNASRLSVSVRTYRLTNATVCVLKRRTTKIKSISTINLTDIINKTATVYSDYTYTQSVSESTRFRSGIGLGYSTSKRNVLWEKGAAATPVSSKGEHLTLQVDGEIRQNLDKGWFLTP